MFCEKCGKEISNQANFCKYCGAQVARIASDPEPQPKPQPKPQPQPQSQPKPQPAPDLRPQTVPDSFSTDGEYIPAVKRKKQNKGGVGKIIFSVFLALCVFIAAKTITEKSLNRDDDTNTYNTTGGIVIKNPPLTDSCIYGGLYQNNTLTYGWARLTLPDYTLHQGDSSGDSLFSKDELTYIKVNKIVEINTSYTKTTKEAFLGTMGSESGLDDPKIVKFDKYTVDGYRIVKVIVHGKLDGVDYYYGELMVFPGETPANTMRFLMHSINKNGADEINKVFDTLRISSEFELKATDTTEFGVNQISQK